MSIELPIRNASGRGVQFWWSIFFYTYRDWEEVERRIREDWHGEVVYADENAGHIKSIRFQDSANATLFLLRWS